MKVKGMMDDLKSHLGDWQDEKAIEAYLARVVRRGAYDKSGLIYGIGHPVYTSSDPRAVLLEKKARELADAKAMEEEFRLHERVARLASKVLQREKNLGSGLCANVDFYSGFVYRMLDIPEELYTPIFAIARIAGWAAHRIEEILSGGKIVRPAYRNVYLQRDYTPLNLRD